VTMSAQTAPRSARDEFYQRSPHPLHQFLLSGAACLLVGGLLSDWAYFSSTEIQWKNFAGWLIFAGLILGGFALLWALFDLSRVGYDRGRRGTSFLLLLAAWILGIINELIHAKDAWASMPEALILSAIAAPVAIAATVLGLSGGTSQRT
jgi:uncharacterized membrane protein